MKKAHKITPKRRSQRGFTMIELFITVTLVAVLAAIAAPSMQTYVWNSRITSTSQELLRTLQTARTESAKRQANVVVCLSNNPTAAAAGCAFTNITGWIMFEDTDGNWVRKILSPAEPLIEVHTFDSGKLGVLADASSRVAYLATGFASPAGTVTATQTPSTTFVICDKRGNVDSNGTTTGTTSVARDIQVAPTGRARVNKSLSDIHADLITTGLSCPL